MVMPSSSLSQDESLSTHAPGRVDHGGVAGSDVTRVAGGRQVIAQDGAMNSVFDPMTAPLRYSDLPAEKCPDGPLATGVQMLASTDLLEVGVWEHPAGRSTDIETDEVFVVLSGSGRVVLADGTVLELRPGIVGVLAAGTQTTWEVDEPLRKVWVVAR
jgi:uncharacterized protein